MQRTWLVVALACVLISACADSTNDSSKNDRPATQAPAEDSEPEKTEAIPRFHAITEKAEVMSSDRLRFTIHVKGLVHVRAGREKELDKWGRAKWYESSISGRVRSELRQEFQRMAIAEVEPGAKAAVGNVHSRVSEQLSDSPFEIRALTIADVELPKVYIDSLRARENVKSEHARKEAELERQVEEMRKQMERQEKERREAREKERERDAK